MLLQGDACLLQGVAESCYMEVFVCFREGRRAAAGRCLSAAPQPACRARLSHGMQTILAAINVVFTGPSGIKSGLT